MDQKWLEYNEDEDKCYSFPCRVFLNKTSSSNKDGYSNWKNARGAEGGVKSHENDEHNQAMKLWDDRDKSSSTIIDKMANKPEHRQWLEAVFPLIKAFVKNGQPLCGQEEFRDFGEGVSGGLHLNLMNDLVFKLRPDLAEIAKKTKTRNTHLIYRTKSSVY